MLTAAMTAPRTRKPAATKPSRTPRAKSVLSQHGDAAKLAAETELLRATLAANGWNATRAGLALGIRDVPTVLRAIERCGLRAEYESHAG